MQVGISWIVVETTALLDPVLQSADTAYSICRSFATGRLDVPFSASRYANAKVVPMRANDGAIRIGDFGDLPISQSLRRRHQRALLSRGIVDVFAKLEQDILWFCHTGPRSFPPSHPLPALGHLRTGLGRPG